MANFYVILVDLCEADLKDVIRVLVKLDVRIVISEVK